MAAITYQQAREQYPNQWLVFEALDGYIENEKFVIPHFEVIGAFKASGEMWKFYKNVHQADKSREYGFYHTSNTEMIIEVRHRYSGRHSTK